MVTKTERKLLIAVVVCIVVVLVLINSLFSSIEQNGGVRNIIIETGKEIKQISKEINEE